MTSERIQKTASSPFWQHLNISVVKAELGESEVVLDVQKEHMQAFGVVHGGALASLVDSAIGIAVQSVLESSEGSSTTNLQVIYLRPAKEGKLTAKAKLIRKGKSMIHGDCSVKDEKGNMIVHGTGSFMVLDLNRWGKDKNMLYDQHKK